MRLSKSRFTAGLQCHKQLWWRVHEPDAPELVPEPGQQALFDQGHLVGAKAREYFPGGVLVDAPHTDVAGRLAQTTAALEARAPAVFEASFRVDDIFVAVDVLERGASGWTIVEVKSSTSVKQQHLPDVAVQAHVLRRAGLHIERVEIMHVNRECRFPDVRNLFARVDVTGAVQAVLPAIPTEAAAQLRMLAADLPSIAPGAHCRDPYECPFLARCWPPEPAHHVRTLYRIGAKAEALLALGFVTIHDLPDDLRLTAIAERQRRAVRENRVIVQPTLRDALEALRRPFAVLDFEAVQLAIPVWQGCRPFDAVPAQFSCHVVGTSGALVHHAWLADGPADPRPEIAARVIEACRGAEVVVAYNAAFEATALRHLAEAAPDQAEGLADVERRLVDALPLVRDQVYHPAFGGSFSLKAVLPALVPGMSYDGLDVASGASASVELRRLMFERDAMDPDERQRRRDALLTYCEQDTLGVVRLLDRLEALAVAL